MISYFKELFFRAIASNKEYAGEDWLEEYSQSMAEGIGDKEVETYNIAPSVYDHLKPSQLISYLFVVAQAGDDDTEEEILKQREQFKEHYSWILAALDARLKFKRGEGHPMKLSSLMLLLEAIACVYQDDCVHGECVGEATCDDHYIKVLGHALTLKLSTKPCWDKFCNIRWSQDNIKKYDEVYADINKVYKASKRQVDRIWENMFGSTSFKVLKSAKIQLLNSVLGYIKNRRGQNWEEYQRSKL